MKQAMTPIVYAALFMLVPFLASLRLHMRGACSVWWLLVAPVTGLFVFCVLVLSLVFMSGDM